MVEDYHDNTSDKAYNLVNGHTYEKRSSELPSPYSHNMDLTPVNNG